MEGAGPPNLEGEGELWSKTAPTQCAEMCVCTRENETNPSWGSGLPRGGGGCGVMARGPLGRQVSDLWENLI